MLVGAENKIIDKTPSDELVRLVHSFDSNLDLVKNLCCKKTRKVALCNYLDELIILKFPHSKLAKDLFEENKTSLFPKYIKKLQYNNHFADLIEYIPGANIKEIMFGLNGWKYNQKTDMISFNSENLTTSKKIKDELYQIELEHKEGRCGFDIKPLNVQITPTGKPYIIDADIYYNQKFSLTLLNKRKLKELDFLDINNLFDINKTHNKQSESNKYLHQASVETKRFLEEKKLIQTK